MDTVDAENILLSHFITEMNNYPLVPVGLDNQNFSTEGLDSWVKVSYRENNSRQRSVGGPGHRKFIRYGFLIYQVAIKPNTATYTGRSICEFLRDSFEAERLSDTTGSVICGDVTYYDNGIVEDWYQFTGNIEFEFEVNK